MKRLLSLVLAGCLTMFLGACGDSDVVENIHSTAAPQLDATPVPTDSAAPDPTVEPMEKLFDGNEIVNSFLTKYNEVAEYPFSADEIERGNVRNKAIISTGDLYITIYGLDLDSGICISIEDQGEPSDSFFPVFRDSLKSIDKDVSDEQAAECWNELQSLCYMVDINKTGMETPYMVNKIQTGYLHSSTYGEMSRADILYYAE